MKVLFPSDFSEHSYNALKYAVNLCNKLNSELIILHSVTTLKIPFIEEEERHAENASRVQAAELNVSKARKFIKDLTPDLKFSFLLVEGTPVEETLKASQNENVDIIMMATEGAHGLKELLFGSYTGKVLDKTEAPLFVVPKEANFEGFKKIIFGTRLKKSELPYFAKVKTLARKLQSSVELLHVSSNGKPKEADEFLEDIKTIIPDVKLNVVHGSSVPEVLQDQMTITQSDLLVLVKSHANLFKKLFGKNVTMEMTLHGKFPLLIYPR